jgi:hypothetical protein
MRPGAVVALALAAASVPACSRGGASHTAGADATAAPTGPLDPDIAAMVASVSADRIAQSIQTLVAFGTRSSCSDPDGGTRGIGAARDWIKAQMEAAGGYRVSLYPFALAKCGAQTGQTRHDVVAVLPGTGHPSRLVVVGGHYDSRTVDGADGTSPAPGANDSGSQTAVVLELARAFAGHAFDATIVLVAFAGEEQGLLGSKALAQDMASVVPGAQVVAMLDCDIVGGDSTANDATALRQLRVYAAGAPREVGAATPDGTPDGTSPSRGLMRYVGAWGGAYAPSMTMIPKLREDRPGRGGDHEPFIAAGRPAVRFIETAENVTHQHTPQDLFQYVTPAYSAGVAQVVAAVAASLARAPDAPGAFSSAGPDASPALRWEAPSTGPADHYVVAARPATESLYRARLRVPGTSSGATIAASDLGVDPAAPYFVSVAAVDARGHESLFAYPEYRCDAGGCAVPAGALDVTATR